MNKDEFLRRGSSLRSSLVADAPQKSLKLFDGGGFEIEQKTLQASPRVQAVTPANPSSTAQTGGSSPKKTP